MNFDDGSLQSVQKAVAECASSVDAFERLAKPDAASILVSISTVEAMVTQGQQRALHSGTLQRRWESLRDECALLRSIIERAVRARERKNNSSVERDALLNGATHSPRHLGDVEVAKESASLQHSRRAVHRMNEESGALLKALRTQGATMRKSHGKLGDVTGGLGMANDSLLQVARVVRVDTLIVMVGSALLLVLMWWLWVR